MTNVCIGRTELCLDLTQLGPEYKFWKTEAGIHCKRVSVLMMVFFRDDVPEMEEYKHLNLI